MPAIVPIVALVGSITAAEAATAAAVAAAAAVAVAAKKKADEEEEQRKNQERRELEIRRANQKAEEDARQRAKQAAELAARKKEEQELTNAKKAVVSFLNEHYKKHKQLPIFISEINQCSTIFRIKPQVRGIVNANPCDEIQNLMIETEKQKSKTVQIDAALFELNHLKGGGV